MVLFFISTDISSVFLVNNVRYTPVVGFISSARYISGLAMHDWLTHPNITNLKLTPIANWQEHPMIKAFLSESALQDPCALGSGDQPQPAIRGRRLRVDLGADCAALECGQAAVLRRQYCRGRNRRMLRLGRPGRETAASVEEGIQTSRRALRRASSPPQSGRKRRSADLWAGKGRE